ncbi:MAG TPA: VWA domain-containing protein [Sandaracinaceae bacterium LLY-WYZ-13_1]|nr:VWA domain-containing protein [Sandaracinaceae bacterium LLY-WYZ-13_1]
MRTTTMAWLVAMGTVLGACGGAQGGGETEDPQVIVLEGDLGNAYVSAGAPADVISRIRIDTRSLPNARRPPINLALVVDTSGSMDGAPIADAREASLQLLDTLHPEDRLTVVAFHSETEVLLPSTRLDGADVEELRARIGRMEARGTTDLAGGLQAGLEELVRHHDPEGINRLVLLSDGVPNDASPVLPLATAAGERGIGVTALGLGLDYDETLLGRVAQQSGGRFHYVEESSAVAQVFRDEVLRYERLLARNLTLEVRPGPGVRIHSVVGQPTTTASGAVRVPLGDLSEGEHRDVIVRVNADARRAGAMVELFDAVLTFDDAVQEAGRLERRVFLGARATADEAELENGRNEEVERAAARMLAAATTVQAIEQARAGRVDEARAILDRAAREAEAVARRDEGLREQVSEMRVLGEALPSMAPPGATPDDVSYDDDAGDAPAAAPAEPPARVIRRAHDRAMGVIQSEAR